eukprot:5918770-Alexandrium_andersonii.AAC.1
MAKAEAMLWQNLLFGTGGGRRNVAVAGSVQPTKRGPLSLSVDDGLGFPKGGRCCAVSSDSHSECPDAATPGPFRASALRTTPVAGLDV